MMSDFCVLTEAQTKRPCFEGKSKSGWLHQMCASSGPTDAQQQRTNCRTWQAKGNGTHDLIPAIWNYPGHLQLRQLRIDAFSKEKEPLSLKPPRVIRLISRSPSAENLTLEEQTLLKEELKSRADEHRRMSLIDSKQPPFRMDVETQEIIAMIRYGILQQRSSTPRRQRKIVADKSPKKVSCNVNWKI